MRKLSVAFVTAALLAVPGASWASSSGPSSSKGQCASASKGACASTGHPR